MAYFDTNAPDRPAATRTVQDDLMRLALIGMSAATLALGVMLAAAEPGSPLAATEYTGEVWHGNVMASGGR